MSRMLWSFVIKRLKMIGLDNLIFGMCGDLPLLTVIIVYFLGDCKQTT